MEAVDALAQLGGASSYSALMRLTTRRRLRSAVARGDVVRLGRDRYVLATAGEAQRLAERVGGLVSHASAAMLHGWELRSTPADPWLIVPSTVELPKVGRARIRVYDALPDEVRGWATAPVLTVLLCARDLDHSAALARGLGAAPRRCEARGAPRRRLVVARARPGGGRAGEWPRGEPVRVGAAVAAADRGV